MSLLAFQKIKASFLSPWLLTLVLSEIFRNQENNPQAFQGFSDASVRTASAQKLKERHWGKFKNDTKAAYRKINNEILNKHFNKGMDQD